MQFILNKKDTPQEIRNEISKFIPAIALVSNYALACTDYTLKATNYNVSTVSGEDYLQMLNYGFLENDNEQITQEYPDAVRKVEINNETYYVHISFFNDIWSYLLNSSNYKRFMDEESKIIYCKYGTHVYTNIIACSKIPTELELVTKKIAVKSDPSRIESAKRNIAAYYKSIADHMQVIKELNKEKVIAGHHPVPLHYYDNRIRFIVPERTIVKGNVEFLLPEIEATVSLVDQSISYTCRKVYPFLLKIKKETTYGWKGFPHLMNNGTACFGNWATYITPAWANGDIDSTITIAIEYLFQVNLDDVAGLTLLYYPSRVVGETKNFDLSIASIAKRKGCKKCAKVIVEEKYDSTEALLNILKEL